MDRDRRPIAETSRADCRGMVGVQQSSHSPEIEVMEGSNNLTRTDVLELARPDAGSLEGYREQKQREGE